VSNFDTLILFFCRRLNFAIFATSNKIKHIINQKLNPMKKLFILLQILFIYLVFFTSNAQTGCNPATITKVEREGTGNHIIWRMPTEGEDVVISQGGDYGGLGTGETTDFGVYHRFTQDDLATINGGTLTQIVFVPSRLSWYTEFGHTFTIQIYKGGAWGEVGTRNPGTLFVSQELNNNNLLANQENTITLEPPVTIDASQELWIGYFCTNIDSIQGDNSAGWDAGPRKEGFGNITFYQNQWQTLYEIAQSADYNWCIKGKVQTIDGATVNIFFNDNKIDSNIPGTTYFHSNPTGDEHCYKVEVNCSEGGVSPLSEKFCIPGVGINENAQIAKFMLYPNPANNELRITNYELQITNVEVYDVSGRKQKAEGRRQKAENEVVMNISNLPAGVYFVKIITERGCSVQRFVKE
jgi:hypothetical protein